MTSGLQQQLNLLASDGELSRGEKYGNFGRITAKIHRASLENSEDMLMVFMAIVKDFQR